jgi:hypothetical protein
MLHEATARDVSFTILLAGAFPRGFWEKALMPMLNFVVFTLFPAPLSLKRQDASLGLAHGACILARRDEYKKIGGHEAVRGEIFEDTSLARIWRARGERGICLDGQDIVHVRMYDSLRGIWNGFQKNFFPAFRHIAQLLALLASSSWFCFFAVSPFCWAGHSRDAWSLPVGLAAVSVLLMRTALSLRFGYPLWSLLSTSAGRIGFADAGDCLLVELSWRARRRVEGPQSIAPEPSKTEGAGYEFIPRTKYVSSVRGWRAWPSRCGWPHAAGGWTCSSTSVPSAAK